MSTHDLLIYIDYLLSLIQSDEQKELIKQFIAQQIDAN